MKNYSTNLNTPRSWMCCATPDSIAETLTDLAKALRSISQLQTPESRKALLEEAREITCARETLERQRRDNYACRLDDATIFCKSLAEQVRESGYLPKNIPAWVLDIEDWEEDVSEVRRLQLFWEVSIFAN